jgi:metal-responsive CopG/Arc/MetJ family transcriptional regulator
MVKKKAPPRWTKDPKEVRGARLGVRLKESLRSALEQLAKEKEFPSISKYVEYALEQHVQEQTGKAGKNRRGA